MPLLSILSVLAMAPLNGTYGVPATQNPFQTAPGPVPDGNPGEWVQTSDYPSMSLRNNEEGVVGFRLTVSPAGLVTNCEISVSSGFAALDEATCRLVTVRARFKPAADTKGQAIVGNYSSRVRWKIPQGLIPPQDGSFTISFLVEKDGGQTDCAVVESSGPGKGMPPIGRQNCASRRFDPPFVDDRGQVVRKRVTVTTTVKTEVVKD